MPLFLPTFLANLATLWHLYPMRIRGIIVITLSILAAPALAAIDPNSGIDFVTIGAVNNPAWTGGGSNNNRGSVGYVYNIGKFEVTTAQWAEFMNAALDRPATDRIPAVQYPSIWGATAVPPANAGGRRYVVQPGRENIPVGGITWRTAAIYANWLHNGKATNRDAFLSGAYEVSTFGVGPFGVGFTDQLTHSPGARYWIPSLDEWMKAAHYDPNKPNADGTIGGWWQYSNSTDTAIPYGPAGQLTPSGVPTQANGVWTDFAYPGFNPFSIPLGAYTNVVSPWGLYDVAGGTSEWTETAIFFTGETVPRIRLAEGTGWASSSGGLDTVQSRLQWDYTYSGFNAGLRIASSVPAPGVALIGACVVVGAGWNGRRSRTHGISR